MVWLWWIFAILCGLILALIVVGFALPKAHHAVGFARYHESPEAVFAAITNFDEAASWQPGVRRIERLPDQNGHPIWLEHTSRGDIPLEVMESVPPQRLVLRINEPKMPFGGTWTMKVRPVDNGSELSITEDGEIYNPVFRLFAHAIFGYHSTLEAYLRSLARKFGEQVIIQRGA